MRRLAAALALGLGTTVPVAAQMNDYEARYGQPVDVTVDSILDMPQQYEGRAVRTHGRLDMIPGSLQVGFAFRGTFGTYLHLVARQEIGAEFERVARQWFGKEVEVTGSVTQGQDQQSGQMVVYLAFWSYLGPPDEKAGRRPGTPDVTLEELVTRADRYDGKTVTVHGQFRGENLFGDLPSASRERTSDWVLKEDVFAVWVTGKKAKGSGWSLDASLRRDTGKWLEVTGRVRVSKGVVTIQALDVLLTKPPGAAAKLEAQPAPTPPPPPRHKRPAVVAFSLPLDGERDVPADGVFLVQFSRDMDEKSLLGRVLFRYAGRPQPGDNALDAVRFSYDGGLRTLKVEPGDLLRPGRVVELVLLPGIVDLDGDPLETRPGIRAGAVTDVLRFQVIAPGLAGASQR